jgi:hypothetical protein
MSKAGLSCVETVADVLEGYAKRGVFRGFSRGPVRNGKVVCKILWHRDRLLELILDAHRHTIRFPRLLPDADSSMGRELREFLKARHSPRLPEHRRIDTRKACVRCSQRGGGIAVSLTVKDGDYEYGARKLIHVVNEVFMVFLSDGRYHEYVARTFNLEPDAV